MPPPDERGNSILVRAISRTQARDKVERNVALLCEVPKGEEGRPSKSRTLDQAEAALKASEGTALHAYVVLSLLLGARTEELRALNGNGLPQAAPSDTPGGS
ncbi:hypothetical protein ABZV14_26430 [Streptosporangium canum]|uniref:hypothetical protein n=1 Tax=Streptosporangium canum TaxID=324952 RepID=UPI0033AA94D5